MRLETFRVQNYRSVVDSGPIRVSDITALIGPNQAGKSSVSTGLASISVDQTSYNDFDLTQLDGVAKKYLDGDIKPEDILIVEAQFKLTPEELEKLKPIVDDATESFKVAKFYDCSYALTVGEHQFRIPPRTVLESANKKILDTLNQFTQNATSQQFNRGPNNQFRPQYDGIAKELASFFTKPVPSDKALEAIAKLEKFGSLDIDQPFKDEIGRISGALRAMATTDLCKTQTELGLNDFLLAHLPKTVYFKSYDRLEDEVTLAELKSNPGGHATFLNLLKLADLRIETLEKIKNERSRAAYIEQASGTATNLIKKGWKQDDLVMQFRYQGDKLMVFTKDSKAAETLLPPSYGSEGFQWFLGFYINFGARTNAEYKNAILLLDDPGVFLHPKGHKDLLEIFEKYLTQNVTTIYSTHLPFLIQKNKLDRIRLIEKISEGRSRVTEKFYATKDKDVLYPIRAAIGVTLGDSLFIGSKTVIVEGVSDKIILDGMLAELQRRKPSQFASLEETATLGVEGADNVEEYAVLMEINKLPYVVVLDQDEKGRAVAKSLESIGIPAEKVIFTARKRDGEQKDMDIEDMFSVDTYAAAFHQVYGSKINKDLPKVRESFKDGNGKANNKAKSLLSGTGTDLDKRLIARELVKTLSSQQKAEKEDLENFESLFELIDKKLK